MLSSFCHSPSSTLWTGGCLAFYLRTSLLSISVRRYTRVGDFIICALLTIFTRSLYIVGQFCGCLCSAESSANLISFRLRGLYSSLVFASELCDEQKDTQVLSSVDGIYVVYYMCIRDSASQTIIGSESNCRLASGHRMTGVSLSRNWDKFFFSLRRY